MGLSILAITPRFLNRNRNSTYQLPHYNQKLFKRNE
jgi:hypothetical protein